MPHAGELSVGDSFTVGTGTGGGLNSGDGKPDEPYTRGAVHPVK